MAGLLDSPYRMGLLGTMQAGLLSQGDPASGYYPTRYAIPGQPNATDRGVGAVAGLLTAPVRIPFQMGMGIGRTLDQANQAMPWGGNDPQAIGLDPQMGTMDPSVMVPFATDVAGMATTGSLAAPGVAGGVGMGVRGSLPMDDAARLARAREMGFDTGTVMYHGSPTMKPGGEFNLDHPARTDTGYLGKGVYLTPQEWIAAEYAKPRGGTAKGTVLPTFVRDGKFKDFLYDENYIETLEEFARQLGVNEKFNTPGWSEAFGKAMREAGYDGARGVNYDGSVAEVVVYDPKNIRQTDAAFDPAQASSPNLLAANSKPSAAIGAATYSDAPTYTTGGRF